MNENLHKLHLKANELAREQACEKNGVENPQQHTIFNEYVEIFAKLIIAECARVADESDCTWTGAGMHAASEIKEHFGVRRE